MFTPSKKTREIDQALRDAEIEQAIAVKAREDPMVYCQFVLRSEQTRKRLTLQQEHHDLMNFLRTNRRAVVIASPKLGKSTLITYGLLTWMIGRDWKRFSALIFSGLKANAEKHLRGISDRMRTSREMRMVFPAFTRPFVEDNTESLRLDREEYSGMRPATIEVASPNPKKTGLHYSLHLADDAMTPELAQSPYLCEQQAEMIMDYESRLITVDNPRWYIQNCYRRWDTGQVLVKKFGWTPWLMPAIDEAGKTIYSFVYSQKACDEYAPSRRDADLRCIPREEGDSEFEEQFIEKARILGLGTTLLPSINPDDLPSGFFIIHGVDPAGGRAPGTPSKHSEGDDAAITTWVWAPAPMWLSPDCPAALTLPLPIEASRNWLRALPNDAMVGRLLWITAGKFGLPEMIDHIVDLHERYGPSAFIVETNGVQVWLMQALNIVNPDILVRPFRTGANKHHEAFGITGLVNELASGSLIIPSTQDIGGEYRSESQTEKLLDEMRKFRVGEHTGDRLQACWLAKHGARAYQPFHHSVGEINMGQSYGLQPTRQPFAAIPGLGQMLEQKAEPLGIPLLAPKKSVKESVDAETKKRFGL